MPRKYELDEADMENRAYAWRQERARKAKEMMAYENSPISKYKRTTAYHLPGEMRDNLKVGAKRILRKLKGNK